MSKKLGNLQREIKSLFNSRHLLKRATQGNFSGGRGYNVSKNMRAKFRKFIDFDVIECFIVDEQDHQCEWHQDKMYLNENESGKLVICSYPTPTEFQDAKYDIGDVIEFSDDLHRSPKNYPRIFIRAYKITKSPKLNWEDRSSDLYD